MIQSFPGTLSNLWGDLRVDLGGDEGCYICNIVLDSFIIFVLIEWGNGDQLTMVATVAENLSRTSLWKFTTFPTHV